LGTTRVLHVPVDSLVEIGQKGSAIKLGADWLATRHSDLVLCINSEKCFGDGCDDPEEHACLNCTRSGHAQVIFTHYGIFRDIPARTIEYAPERRSRRYSGMLDNLKKEHGDAFSEWSACTVLIYRRID